MTPPGCAHLGSFKVDNWKQNLRAIYQCFVWSGSAEARKRKVHPLQRGSALGGGTRASPSPPPPPARRAGAGWARPCVRGGGLSRGCRVGGGGSPTLQRGACLRDPPGGVGPGMEALRGRGRSCRALGRPRCAKPPLRWLVPGGCWVGGSGSPGCGYSRRAPRVRRDARPAL